MRPVAAASARQRIEPRSASGAVVVESESTRCGDEWFDFDAVEGRGFGSLPSLTHEEVSQLRRERGSKSHADLVGTLVAVYCLHIRRNIV